MRLTVLNVGYPLAPVRDDTAGGAEQVLGMIDAALVRAGHRSIVLAPEGSCCDGLLISTRLPTEGLDSSVREIARRQYRNALERTLDRFPVDVIHMHGVDCLDYLPASGIPAIITLHLPPSWYPAKIFQLKRPDTYIVCVSQSQCQSCPEGAWIHRVIENGVPIERFQFAAEKGNYALCLGRICPEKGFHLAMDAACRAGIPLLIAGKAFDYPSHQAYFAETIKPRLNSHQRFLGQIGIARKRELLAGAKCLLVPSLVAETSSLVAMEAMACGTPVIAFRAGALCEIVDDGRTGFLVSDVHEMAAAIARTEAIEPRTCRREAEERFFAKKMTSGYLKLYADVAQARKKSTAMAARGDGEAELKVRVLTTLEQMLEITPEWHELWARCANATTFQRPEWVVSWVEVFRPSQPLLIEIRGGDQLVGIAPLLIYPCGRESVLGFMGGGVSDYLDVLIDPEWSERAMELLWNTIQQSSVEWSRLELTDIPNGSPLLAFLPDEAQCNRHDACPVLELPARVEDLKRVVPAEQLRNLRNARNRTGRAGEIHVEVAAHETAEQSLQEMFRLHARRWLELGSDGVLSANAVKNFHRRVAPLLLERGILRLYSLRLDGRAIATLYAFFERDTAYCYLQGFDPEFKRLSPGTQILGAVIEDAIRSGIRKIDFLRGQEAYKYAWGARDAKTFSVEVSRKAVQHSIREGEIAA